MDQEQQIEVAEAFKYLDTIINDFITSSNILTWYANTTGQPVPQTSQEATEFAQVLENTIDVLYDCRINENNEYEYVDAATGEVAKVMSAEDHNNMAEFYEHIRDCLNHLKAYLELKETLNQSQGISSTQIYHQIMTTSKNLHKRYGSKARKFDAWVERVSEPQEINTNGIEEDPDLKSN